MTFVDLYVHMDCPGCETKIKKALYKLNGVDDVDIDMVRQKVTVTGYNIDQKKVLKAVKKTGRKAVVWPYPYSSDQYNNYNQQYFYNQYQPAAITRRTSYISHEPYCSSYNYRKHGYNDTSMDGYYPRPPYDERTESMFSDDNPHACSVM